MYDIYTSTQDTVITASSADLPVYTFLVLLPLLP
jgi:hypothetical protein